MGKPAYQLIGDIHGGTSAKEGEYGDSPYGDEFYGGDEAEPVQIPTIHIPGAVATREDNIDVAEIEHRRDGALIGTRKIAEIRRWPIVHRAITDTEADTLKPFFQARVFRFIPDDDDEATYVKVKWRGGWRLTPRRGRMRFNMEYELEEAFN